MSSYSQSKAVAGARHSQRQTDLAVLFHNDALAQKKWPRGSKQDVKIKSFIVSMVADTFLPIETVLNNDGVRFACYHWHQHGYCITGINVITVSLAPAWLLRHWHQHG